MGEILANDTTDKELKFRIYEDLRKLNNNKSSLKKWAKNMTKQMANKHEKVLRLTGHQGNKTTIRFCLTSLRIPIIQKSKK